MADSTAHADAGSSSSEVRHMLGGSARHGGRSRTAGRTQTNALHRPKLLGADLVSAAGSRANAQVRSCRHRQAAWSVAIARNSARRCFEDPRPSPLHHASWAYMQDFDTPAVSGRTSCPGFGPLGTSNGKWPGVPNHHHQNPRAIAPVADKVITRILILP